MPIQQPKSSITGIATGFLERLPAGAAVEAARSAAASLRAWVASETAVNAALLAPVLVQEPSLEPRLREKIGDAAVDMAHWSIDLRERSSRLSFDDARSQEDASRLLRQLLLLIYTGWPDFSRVRVALAYHAALLETSKVTRRRAAETWNLFIPVLEAVGWWRLRRQWLEKIGGTLRPQEVQKLAATLEQHADARELAADTVLQRLNESARLAGVDLTAFSKRRSASAFAMRESRSSIEEMARSPIIQIVCAESECYRALGLVHGLGRPVSNRLEDLIAAQKPNGYRALHTSVTIRGIGSEHGPDMVVDVRICSPEMRSLNEEGLIGSSAKARQTAEAMWRRRLDKLQEWATSHGIRDLHGYLDDIDSEGRVNTIFVFSPLGEFFLLSADSTVLDYAYSVHTWLGDHTVGAKVNFQQVELGTPLKAGDIVRIVYDPSASGPDISWLPSVRTKRAKNRLRHSLAERYRRRHPGAEILLAELMRRIDFYRNERSYALVITAGRLDAFLNKLGQVRNLNRTEIFEQIESGELPASKIVRQLVSDELASSVVPETTGEEFPLHRIEFCDLCRPCPEDKIVAVPGKNRRKPSLRVHRPDCDGLQRAKRRDHVAIDWTRGGNFDRSLFKLEIQAQDRYRILVEVLEACFAESSMYLYEVMATGGLHGSAEISLVVSVASMEQLSRIQGRLAGVSQVSNVLSLPLVADHYNFSTHGSPINPYTEQQIFADWMFFDREELLRDLMTWVEPETPRRFIILHGLSGMGKTELSRRLIHQRIRGRPDMRATLIDFQWLTHFDLDGFCRFLGEQLARSLDLELEPPPSPDGDAGAWLVDVIESMDAALEGKTLLVVLDELNYLLEQGADGSIFKVLKAVFRRSRHIKWLTIVQDPYFIDSRLWGEARALFQGTSDSVLVPPLPDTFSRKLVLAPIGTCGYRISRDRNAEGRDVPDQIVRQCGGNPYLLQTFCRHLVNHMQNRGVKDLGHRETELVAGMLRSKPNQHLGHLDRYWELAKDDARVLVALSRATADVHHVGLAELEGECGGVDRPGTARCLNRLESLGLVAAERGRVKRYSVRSLLLQHRMQHF